jgi:hypothetical protein
VLADGKVKEKAKECEGPRAAAARLPPLLLPNKLLSEWNSCDASIRNDRLPGKRNQNFGSVLDRYDGVADADHTV